MVRTCKYNKMKFHIDDRRMNIQKILLLGIQLDAIENKFLSEFRAESRKYLNKRKLTKSTLKVK